jgi:WD40 repeat protein
MKMKTILRFIGVCALTLAMSSLWFVACASGGGSRGERGLTVETSEQVDIEIYPQLGHQYGINSVAFSPNGQLAVSGTTYWERTIKLWDTASVREIRSFTGHTSDVTSVKFSPNGRQVLSGSDDGTMKLWDIPTI